MRVLVVEDNPDMGRYLEQGLREQGFAVDLVADGDRGLEYASTGVYDLLILDRMLPGRDGLDLLVRLRAGEVRTPAIFLTALGTVGDRVQGLDSGGDDYLVKPFSFAELLARIRVVLRRGPEIQPTVLRGRPVARPGGPLGRTGRPADRALGQAVRPAPLPDAARRAGREPHHDPGARLEL